MVKTRRIVGEMQTSSAQELIEQGVNVQLVFGFTVRQPRDDCYTLQTPGR
jgi:hypothetical protein